MKQIESSRPAYRGYPVRREQWTVGGCQFDLTWPADVDDSAARADWGFSPRYNFERAFSEYLIPAILACYAK